MLNYYTNKNITMLAVFLSTIIVIFINYLFNFQHKYQEPKVVEEPNVITIENETQEISNKKIIEETKQTEQINQESNQIQEWKITIPVINIEAPIKQGVSQDVLANYVGHFEETQLENGNIGLAAHNRGNNPSYFKEIKTLQNKSLFFFSFLSFFHF